MADIGIKLFSDGQLLVYKNKLKKVIENIKGICGIFNWH